MPPIVRQSANRRQSLGTDVSRETCAARKIVTFLPGSGGSAGPGDTLRRQRCLGRRAGTGVPRLRAIDRVVAEGEKGMGLWTRGLEER